MAGEPFKKLGFPKNIGTRPYPSYTHFAKAFIPHIVVSVGGLLAGLYWFHHRRNLIEALPSEKE